MNTGKFFAIALSIVGAAAVAVYAVQAQRQAAAPAPRTMVMEIYKTPVSRFLTERPAVAGLAVPGMPLGSPGMEVPGSKPRPYTVLTFDRSGQTKVFATVTP